MTDPTIWHGCYRDGWGELIVGEAFAHPAKFAYGLIKRIYEHGFGRGWWQKGELIADPFGGIGTGGIVAAYMGLRWFGVELEPRFVALFEKNIALHRRKWESVRDPVPVMVQGDSRQFSRLLSDCSAIVTSPPYAETAVAMESGRASKQAESLRRAVEDGRVTGRESVRVAHKGFNAHTNLAMEGVAYGSTPGQIGRLKAGDVDAVITSPPYADSVKGEHGETETAQETRDKRQTQGGSLGQSQRHGGYGATEGNIGNLKADAVVTSPPYADCINSQGSGIDWSKSVAPCSSDCARAKRAEELAGNYGATPGQLGNTSGETYWQAMAVVYDECRKVLKSGGIMCVVVKDYVKGGERVPLCDQTHDLLLSLGFEPVERIRAMVVEEQRHEGLWGEVVEKKERKSFFRRLAESKGSPPIDWEEALVVRAGG